MKVLHLSTHDYNRGAARGAYRLHSALLANEIDSRMLVQESSRPLPNVRPTFGLSGQTFTRYRLLRDQIPTLLYTNPLRRHAFSTGAGFPSKTIVAEARKSDIVHLHWVSKGFLPISTIPELERPIVWTLRDMWPFTGGCHYDNGCGRFAESCGACPVLLSKNANDLSKRNFEKKIRAVRNANITWVALSKWMAKTAKRSPIVGGQQVIVIPNAIDTEQFREKKESKHHRIKSLENKRVIGFSSYGAAKNERKGLKILIEAIKILQAENPHLSFELLVAGAEERELQDFDVPVIAAGTLTDDKSLTDFYSKLHVFVSPSLQEAFGNSALEALSCSTPCVAFKNTGTEDIVEHQSTGWICDNGTPSALAHGIMATLENRSSWEKMSAAARKRATSKFSTTVVANQYRALYQELLEKTKR